MTPEDQIRMLMEENARLRAQIGSPYDKLQDPSYAAYEEEKRRQAMLKDFEGYSTFMDRQPKGQYLRKEPKRPSKPVPMPNVYGR